MGTLYAFEIGARPPSRRLREALRAAGADVEELLREHKAWRDSQSRTLLKQLQVNLEGTRAEASPELPQGVRQDRARARQREEEAPRG